MGTHCSLHAIAYAELGNDIRDLGLRGGLAQTQIGGDLRVRQSPRQQPEHVLLSLSEAFDPLVARGQRAVRLPAGTRRTTRPSTPGSRTASPRAARRTADRSSSGCEFLSRKPVAPASRAPKTDASSSKVVSTNTCVPGAERTISTVADRPSRPGMRMSITTTSGRSRITADTASVPSAASATTQMSMPSRIVREVGGQHRSRSGAARGLFDRGSTAAMRQDWLTRTSTAIPLRAGSTAGCRWNTSGSWPGTITPPGPARWRSRS